MRPIRRAIRRKYVPDAARRAQRVAPVEPGDYEVRLHANYPTKAANVVDRVAVRVEHRSLTHGSRR